MISMQFPPPQFRLKRSGGKQYIFDAIRKKWLLLTEEEWVRQNMAAYLIATLAYPRQAIALEKEITFNGLKKRFDMLIYNAAHQPWMLVECKGPQVSLDENVLQQALRYNMAVPVNCILLTNGEKTLGWRKMGDSLSLLDAVPPWGE